MMMFDENIHTYIVVFCLNIKKKKTKIEIFNYACTNLCQFSV